MARFLTKEDLINGLHEYYNKYGSVPTHRAFHNAGYPGFAPFKRLFGSFKEGLKQAGLLELREDAYQFCDTYTDDQLLDRLRVFMSKRDRIPVGNELKAVREINSSTYDRRFGSFYNALKLIGYDIDEQRNKDKADYKKKLLKEYNALGDLLGRTPHAREIDEYSVKGFCHAMSTYEHHFGSISLLQKESKHKISIPGLLKDKEEMIQDLIDLSIKLGRSPKKLELKKYPEIASDAKYAYTFGSWTKALIAAGLPENTKEYYSKNGIKCLSIYELAFTNMLERNLIPFKKEEKYRDYITNLKKTFRFDYTLNSNQGLVFIEIFGITNNKNYDKKVREKINLCKDNNLKLITLYPNDFKTKDLHKTLLDKLDELKIQLDAHTECF